MRGACFRIATAAAQCAGQNGEGNGKPGSLSRSLIEAHTHELNDEFAFYQMVNSVSAIQRLERSSNSIFGFFQIGLQACRLRYPRRRKATRGGSLSVRASGTTTTDRSSFRLRQLYCRGSLPSHVSQFSSQLLCFFLFSASTGVFRFISHRFESLYDRLNSATRREQLEQLVVYLSAWGFLLHLLLIFLARTVPALGTGLLSGLDRNYLHAVYTPFSFILFYEVLLLVLAIPQSHTSSIGKQYEIISLIVVRRVFKDIGEFQSMEGWLTQVETARVVLLDMLGAVAMFSCSVTVFYHVRNKVVSAPANQDLAGFIALKKIVAVLLSALLVLLAAYNFFTWLVEVLHLVPATSLPAKDLDVFFFPGVFEVMIFTDVLLLIVSIS